MGLENLKYRHWMATGLLLGLGFGAMHAYSHDPVPDGGPRTCDRRQFEKILAAGMEVRNLVLHPPVDGQEWVTGQVKPYTSGSYSRPRSVSELVFTSERLFLLAADKNQELYKNPNGREYLALLKQSYPKNEALAAYRFAWWEIPSISIAIYGGAGFVIIGVIWPAIIALLCGAGLVKRREKDEYDLSRFTGDKNPSGEPTPAVTAAEQDRLAELNAKLEAAMADMAQDPTEHDIDHDAREEAPVKQLQTGPCDPTDAGATQLEEAKEYQGEFYPVVKPHRHKDHQP